MKSLYELTQDGQRLLELIDDNAGQLTPEVETILQEWEGAIEKKADGYCCIIAQLERQAGAFKAEADRLKALASASDNAARRMRDRLKEAMETNGIKKLETERFKLAIQKNSVPSVRCDRPVEDLPERFRRVRLELDREEVLEAWEAGDMLPGGVEVEKGTHLRIR